MRLERLLLLVGVIGTAAAAWTTAAAAAKSGIDITVSQSAHTFQYTVNGPDGPIFAQMNIHIANNGHTPVINCDLTASAPLIPGGSVDLTPRYKISLAPGESTDSTSQSDITLFMARDAKHGSQMFTVTCDGGVSDQDTTQVNNAHPDQV
jgi:hypothetical protein